MNEQTRIAQAAPPVGHAVPFTADDFLRMMEMGAFEGMRAELVRGKIEKMMPAEWTHGELNGRVVGLLYPLVSAMRARIGTDVVIRIDDTTVRAFDVAVVREEAKPVKVLHGADVLLAVEIAETTLSRDMGEKRIDYAAAGVPHYWVVDANRQVVHVFGDIVDGDYAEVSTVRFGEPLAVPGTDGSITID